MTYHFPAHISCCRIVYWTQLACLCLTSVVFSWVSPSSCPHLIQYLFFWLKKNYVLYFKVIYKVLDPAIHVKDPYSLDIQGQWRLKHEALMLSLVSHTNPQYHYYKSKDSLHQRFCHSKKVNSASVLTQKALFFLWLHFKLYTANMTPSS